MLRSLVDEARAAASTALSALARRTCERYAERVPPDLIRLIKRRENPYFYRYYFEPETPEDASVGAFIHKFVGSDPLEEVHSHPWEWCASLILAGAYIETKYKKLGDVARPEVGRQVIQLGERRERIFLPFDINIIRHDDFHRVDLVGGAKDPCWTLFVHGPRRSTWGFANIHDGAYREIAVRTFHHTPPVQAGPTDRR